MQRIQWKEQWVRDNTLAAGQLVSSAQQMTYYIYTNKYPLNGKLSSVSITVQKEDVYLHLNLASWT